MRREPVKSSVIRSVGYDPDEETLEVEFHTGRLYQYFKVPPEEVTEMLTSDSVGGYFNSEIRKQHASREIRDPELDPPMRVPTRTVHQRAKSRR